MFWPLLVIGLTTFIYIALIKPFNRWKQLGVAQYPVWVLWKDLVVNLIRRKAIADLLKKLYDDFPDNRYFGLYQFYTKMLVVRDPDLIKLITVKDFDHFVDHFQTIPENVDPIFSKNLLILKGDKWRDMRATVSPSFTSSKMKIMFGLISECAKQFTRYFQEQNLDIVTLEMKDAFTRFTNDAIATVAFGISCDSMTDRNNTFYLMAKDATDLSGFWKKFKLILTILAPKLAKRLGLSAFNKKVADFFTKLIKDNIKTREEEGIIRPDMIHLLMEARKERAKDDKITEDVMDVGFATIDDATTVPGAKRKKEQITDDHIVAQGITFFFAGFDPVSTLMCFMAHELAVNPEVQERLQSEIDDTLNDCDGSLTYEAMSKMKYLDMIVSESLRKWPPAPGIDRVCIKPYTISPVKDSEKPLYIEKGLSILMLSFGLQRDPQLYPEPDRFDPERFSDENKSNITPYSFLPFGSGPRSCIGNRLALMETKLVFFHLLSKFDITVVEKTTIPLKLSKSQLTMTAEGGFWLGLKPREMAV